MPTTTLMNIGTANPGVQKLPGIFCLEIHDTRNSNPIKITNKMLPCC